MPTIVFASPKGGAGKSTSAVILATVLSSKNASVTMIDADPNKPLARWARLPGRPEKLVVIDTATEDTVIDEIEKAAQTSAFVIVDLEGTASRMVAYAISQADLVIIPTQGSPLDAFETVKAIKLVRNAEKQTKTTIPTAVLFTRTSPALQPRSLKAIEAELSQAGVPIMTTQINERDAFRALFAFGGTLEGLDPSQVSNIKAAITNAFAYAGEVIGLLKGQGSVSPTEKVA